MPIVGGSFADSGSSPARSTPLFAAVRTFLRRNRAGRDGPSGGVRTLAGLRTSTVVIALEFLYSFMLGEMTFQKIFETFIEV